MDGRTQRQLFSSAIDIVRKSNINLREQAENDTVRTENNIVRSIIEGKKKKKVKKKEVLDPVGKEDEDIDNDGDVDKSDSYLIHKRDTIKREIIKAKTGKTKKPKKTLNERKVEIIQSLLDERHDPAALLARAFDREKQERAAGKAYVRDLFARANKEEEPAPADVTPAALTLQTPEEEGDFAAHLAAEISGKRHSYDPDERKRQRDAETPAGVTTRLGDDDYEYPTSLDVGDAESTAKEMDHARMHSAIQDAGGIHVGDHKKHGITSFDLGAGTGQAHKGWMHTSDLPEHKGKIFVPHEVSLGNSLTHAFFQQGKESIGRRLYRHEEGELNNLYGVKEKGIGESTNKTFTQKELTEATISRIKMISKAKKSYDSHPGVDRLR